MTRGTRSSAGDDVAVNGEWRALVIDSVARPRDAARGVIGLGVPQNVVLMAAVAVTCVGMVLAWAMAMVGPGVADGVAAAIFGNPILSAVAEFAGMLIMAALTARVGRALGGTGGFWDALTLIVWLNAVMLIVQFAQFILLVVAPPVAGMVGLATLLWATWVFANFVAELHGFRNALMVLGGVILTAIVVLFAVSVLFAILGVVPQGAV